MLLNFSLKAELVKKAFDALRQLLCTAETTAKPSDVSYISCEIFETRSQHNYTVQLYIAITI